jgi:hypothetical protein
VCTLVPTLDPGAVVTAEWGWDDGALVPLPPACGWWCGMLTCKKRLSSWIAPCLCGLARLGDVCADCEPLPATPAACGTDGGGTSGVVGGEAFIGDPGAGEAWKLDLRIEEKNLEPPEEEDSGPGVPEILGVAGIFGVLEKKEVLCERIGGCEGDGGCMEGEE